MAKKKSEGNRHKGNKSSDKGVNKNLSKSMSDFSKKVNILFFLVFLFGLALAFMFLDLLDVYSSITSERQLKEELKKFYYDSPIGITKGGEVDEMAFVRARGMSAEYIKEKMGIASDFCVYVVDANDHLLRDEYGNPLLLCTDSEIESQFS
jgi:hypothetical protein